MVCGALRKRCAPATLLRSIAKPLPPRSSPCSTSPARLVGRRLPPERMCRTHHQLPQLWQTDHRAATRANSDPTPDAAGRRTRQDIPRQSNLPPPTQMKPVSDAPKTSNRTQAKPSPRPPQHVGPARRTAKGPEHLAAAEEAKLRLYGDHVHGSCFFRPCRRRAVWVRRLPLPRCSATQGRQPRTRTVAAGPWRSHQAAACGDASLWRERRDGCSREGRHPVAPKNRAEDRSDRSPAREADNASAGRPTDASQERSAAQPTRQGRSARSRSPKTNRVPGPRTAPSRRTTPAPSRPTSPGRRIIPIPSR